MAAYINLPVKPDTKQSIDEYRRTHGLKSYDETLRKLLNRGKNGNFKLLADLEGVLEGTPPFVRDKRDRNFD